MALPRVPWAVGLAVLGGLLALAAVVLAGPAWADDTDYEQVVDLTFPLAEDEDYHYIDDFHHGRSGGRAHRATDIMGPHGTPVHAAVGGQIRAITGHDCGVSWMGSQDNPPSWGYAIWIDGDDGRSYRYLHLGYSNDVPASEAYADGLTCGSRVERGEHIGYVGSSGNAHPDYPHLHLEIHQDGVDDPYGDGGSDARINPYPSLVAAEDRGDYPGSDGGDAGVHSDDEPACADPDSGDDPLQRVHGADRYGTAAELARAYWTEGADDVVLATGRDHADAVAGGPLAAALDAPVLLTAVDEVPEATQDALAELAPERVWVVGGTAAVSDAAASTATDVAGAALERLGGADRYETAELIANAVGGDADEVVVAPGHLPDGEAWPAALAAGALGAAGEAPAPLLLTRAEDLPEATARAVTSLDPETVTVVAGDDALAPEVADTFAGHRDVRTVDGGDRYEVAANAAADAERRGAGDTVLVATGEDVPDALTAGAAAARVDGRVLLAHGCDLERAPATVAYFDEHPVGTLVLVGGPEALAHEVARELETMRAR